METGRMVERGATEVEVSSAIQQGERFAAKHERVGFRRNYAFERQWHGQFYRTKQVEVFAVLEGPDWLVITVIVRYF